MMFRPSKHECNSQIPEPRKFHIIDHEGENVGLITIEGHPRAKQFIIRPNRDLRYRGYGERQYSRTEGGNFASFDTPQEALEYGLERYYGISPGEVVMSAEKTLKVEWI